MYVLSKEKREARKKSDVNSFYRFRLVHKNLKDSKIGRGINLVAFDGKTFDVKLTETFDTYLEGIRIIELFFFIF